MELGSLAGKALLLALLLAAAISAALLLASTVGSPSPATRVHVKLKGFKPEFKELSEEELRRALEIARGSPEFRKLLEEGFRVVDAHPIVRVKAKMGENALTVESLEKIGAMLVLERKGERALVLVYFDGRVEFSSSVRG